MNNAATSQAAALSSNLAGMGASLSAAAASRDSALSAQLATIGADIPGNTGLNGRAPMPTAAPEMKTLFPRQMEIGDGVSCFGSAISLGASDYSAQVASATAAHGQDVTLTRGNGAGVTITNNGAGATIGTTEFPGESGGAGATGSTNTAVASGSVETGSDGESAAGSAGAAGSAFTSVVSGGAASASKLSTTGSKGGAAFPTQAPGLLVGGAAAILAYGAM